MNVLKLTVSALLIAIGIAIPMVMPIRFVMEPASFTLASHVPIFIAMMFSPGMAVAVAIGTTIGFFFSTPIVIAMRAASHLIFAVLGGVYLKKYPGTLQSPAKTVVFSLVIGIIHAACEVVVVSLFYFGGAMGEAFYAQGFLYTVILLIGVGSVIHSMVDFAIALPVYKALSRLRMFSALHS